MIHYRYQQLTTTSMNPDYISEHDIRYEQKYRSNPTNWYHDTYQRMINRIFLTAVYLLYCIVCFVANGLGKGAALIYLSTFGCLVLWGVALLFWTLKDDIHDGFIDFFTGY